MELNIESEDFEAGEIARAYAVQEALQSALDAAYQQADERQLHAEVLAYTVESCMQNCVSLLELTFVARESQPLDPDPLTEASWQSDVEAAPCAPDTWMRGVIRVKQPEARRTTTGHIGEEMLFTLQKPYVTPTEHDKYFSISQPCTTTY